MKQKSYYADSVEAAMSQARRELGPEAMLVRSRKSPPEGRHLGSYEVLFALDSALPEPLFNVDRAQDKCGPVSPETSSPWLPRPGNLEPWEKLSGEVADLRRQIEHAASAIARASSLVSGTLLPDPELSALFSSLSTAEVLPELARDAIVRIHERRDRGTSLAPLIESEVGGMVRVDATLGRPGRRRIVALVGPPGVGKTTTIVKLAARHVIEQRKPVELLSLDTSRVGGADQLRSYAAILGLGFQSLDSVGALGLALEEHRQKDLILIDTPGHAPQDMDHLWDLAVFLSTHPDVETHLVLTASMKSADLSRAVDRFGIFRPGKLLFTRLDETETYGPIFNEAVRTGKPISFFSGGQRIPEDLEPATTARFLRLLVQPELLATERRVPVAAAA